MNKEMEQTEKQVTVEDWQAEPSEAMAPPAFHLRVLSGRHSGAVMPLQRGKYSLGQDEECDFIFLDDAFLGGKVLIDTTGGEVVLETTGAVKATVGGQPMTDSAVPLQPYQDVEVGATRFAYGPADAPWPEPAPLPAAEPQASPEGAVPVPGPASDTEAAPVAAPAPDAPAARRKPLWMKTNVIITVAASVVLVAVGVWLMIAFSPKPDPRKEILHLLKQLRLNEITVTEAENNEWRVEGFTRTEDERARLMTALAARRFKTKARIVSAEETIGSVQSVLDSYRMDFFIEVGEGGKTTLRGVNDNARDLKEILQAVGEGVQSQVKVEGRFFTPGTILPYMEQLLAGKILAHKVRLQVKRGRLLATLVKNQMDAEEMRDWGNIKQAYKAKFGMDVSEAWTDRLPPTLYRFAAAIEELDQEILSCTPGEFAYLTMRNGRKYFEGARLKSGPYIKSIEDDRIVLSIGTVEEIYYTKKGE